MSRTTATRFWKPPLDLPGYRSLRVVVEELLSRGAVASAHRTSRSDTIDDVIRKTAFAATRRRRDR